MKTLAALGVLAGGGLLQPTPKAVASTLLWLASRTHPAISALVLVLMVSAWRINDDD
ncbi:hypothetical protein SAMN05421850_11912 [Lutimaribacter saemankumensis]|uniref:Uncharacterized protein n=1 Tax=Lutimaribacter saemankumensis TaxID=490829 RepID=A0A1G8TAE9_9RHOB|nr:hypothetical protein SAMN05421850_11912 [Lutimaribacter saemankumensis]